MLVSLVGESGYKLGNSLVVKKTLRKLIMFVALLNK